MRKVILNEKEIILDSGLFFGRGAFETILIKDKPIFLKEHVKRLNKSIKGLTLGETVIEEDILKIINKNKYENIALKVIVTEKNLIFTNRELKYTKSNYEQGFKIKLSNVFRNTTSQLCKFKTLNYLENIIEYELAHVQGYNEAIFINEKGNIAEGCTTNVFIVKNNKIYTPTKSCGILPGIIREWVIEEFNVTEKEITKEAFLNSDEIFLTNSLVGVIKVSEVEGKSFGCNIIEEIMAKYKLVINGGDNDE